MTLSIEAVWGADPLERVGGFQDLEYDSHSKFQSSLAPNGTIRWETVFSRNAEITGQSAKANLEISFPDIDWQFLVSIYGWAALQYQAWARGHLENINNTDQRVEIYTDGVLEMRCNNESFFGGDVYGFRKSPIVLSLKPGRNVLDIRIFRDVRAMGGTGDASTKLALEAKLAKNTAQITNDPLLISEKIRSRLASPYASTVLRNTGEKVALARIGKICNGLKSIAAVSQNPILLYPGQTKAVGVMLHLEGEEVRELSFSIDIEYPSGNEVAISTAGTLIVSTVLSEKSIHDPHRFTFLHPSGAISYAILRPPFHDVSIPANGESIPILLNLHGAGVEADSEQVRHTLDGARGLAAWVLFPSGMTPWSGDDWRKS